MSPDPSQGKLQIAIARFLSKYPLLGGLVATWSIRADNTIPTMGIGLADQGFILIYSPDFVARLRMDELVGVLHHEAKHAIYGHLFMAPDQYPDQHALVIAQEVTVNENLPEPLPRGCIKLKDYPRLKPNQDTDTRYRKLAKRTAAPKPPPSVGKAGTKGANQPGADQTAPPQPGSGSQSTPAGSNGQDASGTAPQGSSSAAVPNAPATAGPPGTQAGAGGGAFAPTPKGVPTVDDHSHWQEVRDAGAFSRGILDSTIQQILSRKPDLSAYEKKVITEAAKECGSGAGHWLAEMDRPQGQSRVDWRVLLRRYVGECVDKAPSLSRPPRRFPHLTGIVPGSANSPERPKIMAVIDTSGSMTDSMLSEICRELAFLAQDRDVWVVECDAEIQKVYRYRQRITEVAGRGGTSFIPPLEPAFLYKQRPDLVIFFTDGLGPAPQRAPQVKVVWVLTPDGRPPVSWGKVIRMP